MSPIKADGAPVNVPVDGAEVAGPGPEVPRPALAAAARELGGFLHEPLWWCAVLAIAFDQVHIALMNSAVFPLYANSLLATRDISTLFSALVAFVLYVVAVTRPLWVKPSVYALTATACLLLAGPAMVFWASAADPVPLVLASLLRSPGHVWVSVMVALCLVAVTMRHGTRAALGAVCGAWALAYLLEAVLAPLPQVVSFALFVVLPLGSIALAYGPSSELIGRLANMEPALDLRVTHPSSFLPLGHAIFIVIILLKMSFGFAMTFSSIDATPLDTVLACVPVLVISLALALMMRPGFGLNAFYRATMLCVLAGFLLVSPAISEVTGMPALANVILRAGGDLARMLALLLVAYIGARNPMNALPVALYLCIANALGSVLGAQLGMVANDLMVVDAGLFGLLLAAIVFVFVAFNVCAPKSFDFDGTVLAIEELQEPEVVEEPSDRLALAVATIACDYSLTPREAEALDLLAHGRNTQAIQDRLTISRSTAKTHVRNVYAKLGVHSQQALIDLVEKTMG